MLTYNTHHGADRRGVLDVEAVAATIAACQPDLAALQEVDRAWGDRSAGLDQPDWYGARLGMRVSFAATIVRSRDSGPPAEYGLALLSRWPLSSTAHQLYTADRSRHAEPRGWQQAVVSIPGVGGQGRSVQLVNTHLSVSSARLREAESAELVTGLSSPAAADPLLATVLAGDFNAGPRSRAVRTVRALLCDTWDAGAGPAATTPSGRRLDYLWCSPQLLPVRSVVVRSAASDHYPVVTDLAWR